MIYRPYGKTGKHVSVIGMGGMRFRKEDYATDDWSRAIAVVHRAHELGVNYFDTAPGYCDDTSEKIFGEAFKSMSRDSFYVSTKCGLWNARTAKEARKMIDQSLRRLGVDHIDFYNMWSVKTLEDYREYLKKGGVLEGAREAQKEGLISHICFTTHLRGEEIAQVANDGIFEGVTLGYNAINFAYRQKGIDACHEANLGIVTMNPLGGGIIPAHPEYFSFLKQGDDSLAVSALKFILSQNKATLAIPGFSTVEEVEENVLAADNLKEAPEELLDELAKHLTSELNSLCTTCAYCDSCPQDIPIPQLLDSYNMLILSNGDEKQMFTRMKNHWGVDPSWATKCIACGKCERLCTQKLPIIKRLAEISGYLGRQTPAR
ncbi:MAG: aldo/keto reductase [Sphaerochaetaceae bacterium]|jgi:predicted aldo/keto reductase-like oxidoreductase|nr:aldo/keto reductase [Sphaerochaetaceae bacterium]MDX9939917.1 aldo/keto reductase [Sphaerochaetaceae bacterium]